MDIEFVFLDLQKMSFCLRRQRVKCQCDVKGALSQAFYYASVKAVQGF